MDQSASAARVTDMKGPAEGFEDFYGAHYRPVVGLLVALGGDNAVAEEISQDSFIKALQGWQRIRGYDNPGGWVRLVAVRSMMSHLRKLKRRRQIESALDPVGPRDATPHDRLAVQQAVDELSVEHRQVIVLHYAADLPLAEIAHLLHIPIGTVQSRLSRARGHLATYLSSEEKEDV